MTIDAEYPIGTTFTPRGKNKAVHTVIDIYKTYNSSGVLVKTMYVTVHRTCGQQVVEQVPTTTIAMSLDKPSKVVCW